MARAGCCAMAENAMAVIGIELLAAAQGCDFHAPLSSSAPLEAVRALLRERGAAPRRRPPLPARHARRPIALVRSGRARGSRRRRRAAGDRGRTADDAPAWLTVTRGEAPLLVSLPHTGTGSRPDWKPRLVSPWLARKDADWWIDQLYDFAADLGATIVRTAMSRTVIDVNRDPVGRLALSGPGHDRPVPDRHLRRRAALSRGRRARTPARSPSGARATSSPITPRLQAEIARLRAMHPRVVLYDCHSIRSVIPRLFDGELPVFNIGTNDGTSCDAGA